MIELPRPGHAVDEDQESGVMRRQVTGLAAGDMDTRIVIQAPTESAPSAAGEITLTWSDLATRWCAIEDLDGREFYQVGQVRGEATRLVRIRPYAALTTRHRFKLGTVIYAIERLLEPGDYQDVLVKELV